MGYKRNKKQCRMTEKPMTLLDSMGPGCWLRQTQDMHPGHASTKPRALAVEDKVDLGGIIESEKGGTPLG